ncbi:MAG: N-formylglutamate amidohydrolase [Deltaproteobacteria bacterium]
MGKRTGFIITCEHAGNQVPAEYVHLFAGYEGLLAGHRGWDPGALECARELASRLKAPLLFSTVTRLLVDLNRSPGHPGLYSEATRGLSQEEKARIFALYHRPHWRAVEAQVERFIDAGRCVVHIAVHSFTPVLDGEERRRFPEDAYMGIEIEINQRFPLGGGEDWEEMKRAVVETPPAADG